MDSSPALQDAAPARTLPESPWLVTLDLQPTDRGALYGQRFHEGQLERTLLDANGYGTPAWSPNGQWLTYQVNESPLASRGPIPTSRWVRRLDDDGWHEAQLVHGPEVEKYWEGSVWSPASDALVFETVRSDGGYLVNVAMVRDDGAVDPHILAAVDAPAGLRGDWSSTGDRFVLGVGKREAGAVSVHDVKGTPAGGLVPSRELVPPSGLRFAPAPFRDAQISPDEQWVVADVADPADTTSRRQPPYLVPLAGEVTPRAIPRCSFALSEGFCTAWGWHPSVPVLLFERLENRASSLAAFFPQSGNEVALGIGSPRRWLTGTAKLLVRDDTHLAIVDLTDPAAPVRVELNDGDPSTIDTETSSPDGRWLLFGHRQNGVTWWTVLDLRGPAPWTPKEIARSTAHVGVTWEPNSRSVLVSEPAEFVRARRIDLESNASTILEFRLGPTPSNFGWSWFGRSSPEDGTIVTAYGGHLALLPYAAPPIPAPEPAPLGDTPDWSIPSWRPADVRR